MKVLNFYPVVTKRLKVSLFAGLCLAFPATQAEVVHTNAHSFDIKITTEVNASAEQAYAAFINVGQWWNPEHSYFGKSEYFSINPIAGGCFCEVNKNQQVQHMQVVYVEPNKQIKLLGGLGPLQMMAANGAMSWKFSPNAETTTITQTYSVTALNEDVVAMIAKAVNAVQTEQQNRLGRYIHEVSNKNVQK